MINKLYLALVVFLEKFIKSSRKEPEYDILNEFYKKTGQDVRFLREYMDKLPKVNDKTDKK